MKKSKLDSPPIKDKVVKRLAVGESQWSIAKDVGLHPSQTKLMEVVPAAVENVRGLVREMPTIPKKATKRRREHSYKASLNTLKAVGITGLFFLFFFFTTQW